MSLWCARLVLLAGVPLRIPIHQARVLLLQVTLHVDVRLLARLAPPQQAYWVQALASLRSLIMAAPLRWG